MKASVYRGCRDFKMREYNLINVNFCDRLMMRNAYYSRVRCDWWEIIDGIYTKLSLNNYTLWESLEGLIIGSSIEQGIEQF